jgi:flagellar hook-associated protein 2
MATSAVGASSIDVQSLVSQLMTIERQPLVKLQQKEATIQSRLTAMGRVKSALDSLQDAANKLSLTSTFGVTKASAAGDGVVAAVSGSAQVGSYAVSVSQLARAQSNASAAFATATTDVGSGTVTLRSADGSTVLATINVGDAGTGTLTEIRDEINAANVGVRASLINDGGQTRLVLNSKETGAANGFQVEASAGLSGLAFTQNQTALDANFSINGLALTSASNTVSSAVEGLTLTLARGPAAGSPPGTTVDTEVTVARDNDSVKTAVADFVKAYNEVEKLIGELTKYDPNTRTAAVLNGESALRSVQNSVRSILRDTKTAAAGEHTRLSSIGVEFQRDGTLKLNETRFGEALASDADKVSRLFSTTSTVAAERGFAVRLSAQIDATIGIGGALNSREEGMRASIRTLDQQQERMEARLEVVRKRLTVQYSRLDALITQRDSQSSALANALAGLTTTNSG